MMEAPALDGPIRLVLGSAALFVLYYFLKTIWTWESRRKFRWEHQCKEAKWVPQRERILGIDVFLVNMKSLKDHVALQNAHKRFTELGVNTFQLVVLGRHIHQTREPENLKTIQAIDFKKWALGERRVTGFAPLLGSGIFTTNGQEWQHSRDMLRPNFVRSQVGDLETFETHVSHLIAAVPAKKEVDLSELFFRLTIDSATEFLFGESTESLTKPSNEGFAEAFTASQDFIANRARWGNIAKLFPANTRFEKDRKFVHDFVDYFVDKGMAKRAELLAEKSTSENRRYVFLDELVRQTTDRVRIRSELLNILLAGRDTTASLLTNAWWVISHRPDIWAKLQAEIAALNGAIPTWEQLKDMKYLKAVLNESLRLHPVVPFNSREATEDTTLPLGGGLDGKSPVFIKKGDIMTWNVYSMHRRKDYYGEDAEEFRPERWLDDPKTGKKGLRPGWEYLPFNGGPRICLGQQFALTEASYTTVRMCQAFKDIESRDSEPWTELLTLTCVSKNGAKVALTPR